MIMFSSQSKSTMNYTYNVTINNVNVAEIVILLWRIAQWASLRSTYITTTHTAITSGQKKYLKRWRIPTSLAIITAAKGELVSCWVCGLYDYVLSLSILLILFLFETATPPQLKNDVLNSIQIGSARLHLSFYIASSFVLLASKSHSSGVHRWYHFHMRLRLNIILTYRYISIGNVLYINHCQNTYPQKRSHSRGKKKKKKRPSERTP